MLTSHSSTWCKRWLYYITDSITKCHNISSYFSTFTFEKGAYIWLPYQQNHVFTLTTESLPPIKDYWKIQRHQRDHKDTICGERQYKPEIIDYRAATTGNYQKLNRLLETIGKQETIQGLQETINTTENCQRLQETIETVIDYRDYQRLQETIETTETTETVRDYRICSRLQRLQESMETTETARDYRNYRDC